MTRRPKHDRETDPASHGAVTVPARVPPTSAEMDAMQMWITSGAVPAEYLSSALDGGVAMTSEDDAEVVLSAARPRRE